MRNGKMLDVQKQAVRDALTETNISWAGAARILGMTTNGVTLFAKRHKIVKPGKKLGEKKWVLA